MKAIRYHEFGGPEALKLEDVRGASAPDWGMAILVASAGVQVADTMLRRGQTPSGRPLPELPFVPGGEVAGMISARGVGIDPARYGERVVATLGAGAGPAGGGYAEGVGVHQTQVRRIPRGMRNDVAVAMIGSGRTAFAMLHDAPLTRDDVVVVTGAAGSVGNVLVQQALADGALAIGLVGTEAKAELVRELGTEFVFDTSTPNWPDDLMAALRPLDPKLRVPTVLFDVVGGEIADAAATLLAPGGRIVIGGLASGRPAEVTTAEIVGRGLSVSSTLGDRYRYYADYAKFQTQALRAASNGTVRPLIHPSFRLEEAAAAHAAIEARQTTGKVVLHTDYWLPCGVRVGTNTYEDLGYRGR